MTTFTTHGSVRGGCGHRHRTAKAAQDCCDRDQRACAGPDSLYGGSLSRGYSDRIVAVVIDGILYHDVDGENPVWPSHGRSCGAETFP